MTILADYKLNVKAAKLSHLADEADCSLRFSPSRRIEDAMKLLPLLPDGQVLDLQVDHHGWFVVNNSAEVFDSADEAFAKADHIRHGQLPRAITEAFIAAMEAKP